jgi:predicted MFS family arabinose efflux permease
MKDGSVALPWALIGAACLGSFAATSSGTTRAPFLLEMSADLDVSMPLIANLVSLTATAWGIASALAGWLSDIVGRRPVLAGALMALALTLGAQAMPDRFPGSRCGRQPAAAAQARTPGWCSQRSPRACRTVSAAVPWAG